ncbi:MULTISPECIES: hypothetical protein [Nocardia]|uniref:hypothetical protein n=1 Tax=Nocardia TaxID=1817 RepID=UPI000D685419|nr:MULTISPECIES: hypothetical protein [Nocardia]
MDDSYVPVSDTDTDGTLRWQIWASDGPTGIGNQIAGAETLMTRVRITGPGVEDTWGFGGPKLYPGERIHYAHSRCDGLPEFVLAQFDPTLEALHIQTTRRLVDIPTTELPVAFGLKFFTMPLRLDEELLSVTDDHGRDRVPGTTWPVLPPRAGIGFEHLPD